MTGVVTAYSPQSMWQEARIRSPESLRFDHHVGPFDALGHPFTVSATDRGVARFVARAYEPMLCDVGESGAHFHVISGNEEHGGALFRDGKLICGSRTGTGLLVWLSGAVNRLVTSQPRPGIALHAAAAARSGQAVILPAPMESGKTTLVTSLVLSGLDYVTDEAVLLGDGLDISGLPKPLSIDEGSWHVLREVWSQLSTDVGHQYFAYQWLVPALDIGKVASNASVRLIVFPRYRPDEPTELRPVTANESLLELHRCRFPTELSKREILESLASLAGSVPTYRLSVSNLEVATALICERLDR